MKHLWLLCLMLPMVATGAKKKGTDNRGVVVEGYVTKGLFLFDYSRNDSLPASNPPRPNRVHVRFAKEFNDWVFVLSDERGRFAEPMEVMVAGSVVDGARVGALPGQRFRLHSGGRWLPTTETRRLKLIVLSDVPTYKTVSWVPVGKDPIGFVNPDFNPDQVAENEPRW